MTNSIHIVPTIDNEASGPSYSVSRLCEALRAARHPTKLAVLEPLPSCENDDFVTAFPYGLGPRRLGFSREMRRWLRAAALSGEYEIFHNHSLWMMPNVYPAKAVKGTSCKLVVSPRGTLSDWAMSHSANMKKALSPLLLAPVMNSATAFHATAYSEYEDIRRLGFKQPVAIIPNGVDIADLDTKVSMPLKTVLFLSRIHPKKAVDNLLHAWRAVQDRFTDWQLVIAGPDDGGYLGEMKILAEKLALERYKFTGPLYGDDKRRAYGQAALYVLPTHSENFGMTVAEALAAATPAIVTKGAPWQGLEREGAGWWIDIGVGPLVAAFDQALTRSPEELTVMGHRGRDWMIRDFSWETIADDFADFYSWLINGGEKPQSIVKD